MDDRCAATAARELPLRYRTLARAGVVLGGATLFISIWPDSALAHGLVGKRDLPIPGWLVGWAAAIVLVISFVALAVLWPKPRWEHLRERRLFGVPRVIEAFVGALGAALFLAAIFIAFGGQQTSNDNLFPTLIFALFWVGLPIVSLLFGDVYRAINPYRAVGRVAGWVMQR